MKYLLAVVLVVAACATPHACPRATAVRGTAALGDTFTIDSRILGERRVINVYVPPGYDKSTDRYPVMYMADGGMAEDFPHVVGSVDVSIKNAVIRPLIVVGVENTERRRDLVDVTVVPEEQKAAPHAGGSAKFRAFLRDELRPLITQRYRTTAETAIIGESLAGLFVIETLILEPSLFDHYIAADPSVWWNEENVVRQSNRLAWWTAGPKTVYVATSSDQPEGLALLATAIRIYAPPIEWTYEPMPDEQHGTIFPTAALHGIRHAFRTP
jgi:predicted alpha/beta superfamily hydrolase